MIFGGFVLFLFGLGVGLGLVYRASYGVFALLCPLTCYVMLCYVNVMY